MPRPSRGDRGVPSLIDFEQLEPVGGGDLNEAFRARLTTGEDVFVKTRDGADAEEYRVEAASLRWLDSAGGVRVPAVVEVGEWERGGSSQAFLSLEWIEPGRLSPGGAKALGRDLARTHRAGAPSFGERPSGAERSKLHIGPLTFSDAQRESWPEFYAEQRLVATARIARERGSLSAEGARLIDRVCNRIDELAGPPEPPARLHGDLWSGNVMADAAGQAVLIDPASYGGHRELDLAMLRLFGAPGEGVFAAYEEEWPIAEGWPERVGLWQLFPLLVHAALFGAGWGGRAEQLARRYL